MSWYKLAKKKEVFDYGSDIRSLWNNILNAEKKRVNISFDLENNDSKGKPRTIDLSFEGRGEDQFRLKADMSWAGGDWESPITYFKCQIQTRYKTNRNKSGFGEWSNDYKCIIIPIKGNNNLIKGDKFNYVSRDGEEHQEADEKTLWEEVAKEACERMKKMHASYGKGDGSGGRFENTGLTRELSNLTKDNWK